MQEDSRTVNSVRNTKAALIFKVVNLITKFFMRTTFIYVLGQTYVGVNGVFSNLLSVLSLTELGIGTAIVYDMYKPIAEKDKRTIVQLFSYYKKIYRTIGLIIFCLGMAICPFLGCLIKDSNNVPYLSLIYILTLVSTVVTYFYAYYSSLISAHQKQSIINGYQIIGSFLKTVVEITILVVFKSYILYLIAEIVIIVIMNVCIAKKAVVLFPYIKESASVDKISSKRVSRIWNNSLSLFSLKIAITVVNTTDNLLISSLIGTKEVACYSTYILIIKSVEEVVYSIKDAVIASVGNLCATCDYRKKQEIFDRLKFVYSWINCIVVSCFFVLLNPFIKMWAGDSYLLPDIVVLLLVLNYYMKGLQWPVETFYTADGLYKYFRIKPWIQAGVNLIMSIVLATKFGIAGIALGTTISELVTTFWYDIYIVNKYSLKSNLLKYYCNTLLYLMPAVISAFVCLKITSTIKFNNSLIQIMIRGIVTFSFSMVIFIIPFVKNKNFKYVKGMIRKFLEVSK